MDYTIDDTKPAQKKKSFQWKYVLTTLGGLLVLLLLLTAGGTAYYFYSQYQSALANPKMIAEQTTQNLIDTLGKLIELPTDEKPTIATVNDKSKLIDQPFFAHAENGDKVFIYAKNKKAILYRPSTNKIIEVASITLTDDIKAGTNLNK